MELFHHGARCRSPFRRNQAHHMITRCKTGEIQFELIFSIENGLLLAQNQSSGNVRDFHFKRAIVLAQKADLEHVLNRVWAGLPLADARSLQQLGEASACTGINRKAGGVGCSVAHRRASRAR